MSKRTKKSQQPTTTIEDDANGTFQSAVQDAAAELTTDQPAEVTEEVTAEPVVADDVLAMLAGDDAAEETPEPVTATDDAAIEADDPTDAEVLATIQSAGSTSKSKGKSSTPKAPPAVLREFTAVAQIDKATLDANLAGCNAKKVREKAENLIAAVQSGKKLSRYTQVAVKQLVANGSISGKDMVSAFLTEGLKEGTARAQAQQMTALFRLVGAVVADPATKGRLVANDAGLIAELEKLAA